jgi:hypothetical protein
MKFTPILKICIYSSVFFSLLSFLQTCGSKGKVTDNKKKIEVLESKVDSLINITVAQPNSTSIKNQMEQTMYKFLIYEDDLDKGKTSLSDIKSKIDE